VTVCGFFVGIGPYGDALKKIFTKVPSPTPLGTIFRIRQKYQGVPKIEEEKC